MTGHDESQAVRTKALVALGVAATIGIVGWFGISRATERGLARLATIERVRVACIAAWQQATTEAETLSVDRIALADTIDAQSSSALRRCGDLRPPGRAGAGKNAREMSGEPLPRGLR